MLLVTVRHTYSAFFDRGNIDGFNTKLAIHQNFPFQ